MKPLTVLLIALWICTSCVSTDSNLSRDFDLAKRHRYCSAIYYAAEHGRTEIVKSLLRAGVYVNGTGPNGSRTALHVAASNGHLRTVKVLIKAGANVDATSPRRLFSGTPLHEAALRGHPGIVKILIEAGSEVNAKGCPYSFTPLDFALSYPTSILNIKSRRKKAKCAKLLRKHGGKTNKELSAGEERKPWTPLHDAANKGQTEKVKTMIAGGADVNAKEKYDCTPLYLAGRGDYVEVVEALIEAGADVNAKERLYGNTPLGDAAFGGGTEMVELLLAAGAKVNARDKNDHTPLDVCIIATHDEFKDAEDNAAMMELLKKHGGKTAMEIDYPLHHAASEGDMATVKALLKAKAEVNARDRIGRTPLHLAACKGHTAIAKLLIKAGARVNLEAEYGTPLGWASEHPECAELLRKHGAKTSEELGW